MVDGLFLTPAVLALSASALGKERMYAMDACS